MLNAWRGGRALAERGSHHQGKTMNILCRTFTRQPLRRHTLLAVAAWLCAGPAIAAPAVDSPPAGIEATYQAERKNCLEGRTGQDQATCLKEAGAVRQQAHGQGLDGGQTGQQLKKNREARCDGKPTAEREDCQRMARGEGRRSGSVGAGGVMMELTTRSAGAASAPTAASTAPPASSPAAAMPPR
jgi:hypothetical protein